MAQTPYPNGIIQRVVVGPVVRLLSIVHVASEMFNDFVDRLDEEDRAYRERHRL